MTEQDTHADVLVVGGGPAGLSAALYLARWCRSVVVLDTGEGRSTHHQTNHNYLGFPDGVSALDLRARGREQLARYPHTRVVLREVERLERGDAGFVVEAEDETWTGRALVLATGVHDHYPRFDGWESYVGTSVFWCITCDGYENRGKDVVVVGHTDAAAAEALMLRSLTDRVRVLTNHDTARFGERARARLAAAGIPVIEDRIVAGVGAEGRLEALETEGGERLALESLFSLQGATPRSALAAQLGVELDEDGYVVVDTEQRTSVPGVYAAGDVTALHSHQVTTAVHEGAQAACAANWFLCPEDLKDL